MSENNSITTRKIGTTRTTTSRTTSTTKVNTNDDVDSLHFGRSRGASQHALSLHASFHSLDDHTQHSLAQVLSAMHGHLHDCFSLTRPSPRSTFLLFLLSVSFFHFYLELFPERLYTKDMANLRRSATNESEDTYDVFNPPTGYEPKAHDFDELENSSVPFSFMIPG